MPERIECEVLHVVRYMNTLTFSVTNKPVFVYHWCVIQRKEQEQLQVKQRSSDGSKSTNYVADAGDNATSNFSSIPPSTAIPDDVVSSCRPLNANGRALVHRHGLANGMPAQAE